MNMGAGVGRDRRRRGRRLAALCAARAGSSGARRSGTLRSARADVRSRPCVPFNRRKENQDDRICSQVPATSLPRRCRWLRVGAQAQDKVTVQLKWLPQAQFAGYYVAAGEGLLQGRRPRRHDQAGRPRHLAGAGAGRRTRPTSTVNWMPERAGRARGRRADGQHRADLQPLGADADLQEGQRRQQRRRTSRARRWASGSAATSTRSSTGWPSSA